MAKTRIALCYLILAPLFLLTMCGGPSDAKKKTPDGPSGYNLLLVTIDTLRADYLSCYDSRYVSTPILDGLAERGVRFTRAFAHTPTTLPSHANILTGTLPLYHGVHENGTFVLHEDHMTLAEFLKQQGYATAAVVGAYPLDERFGLAQGFDLYDDDYSSASAEQLAYVERPAERVVERAAAWLSGASAPWFLWVHCYDPHDPYRPPEPYLSQHSDQPYAGEVAYVDAALEPLFDILRDSGLEGSTLVVMTGDHGESLGDHGEETHGYYAYNSSLWIPLMIAGPGVEPGTSVDAFVGHCDIFPTVCDWLGFKQPGHLQGQSLVPALKRKKTRSRAIYFESLYPYYSRGWAPLRGMIQDGSKFILSPIPELYDLEEDFSERRNVITPRLLRSRRGDLEKLIERESSGDSAKASRPPDRETLEKLRTLGYIAAPREPRRSDELGPSYDIKTLLPFHSKSTEALALYREGRVRDAVRMLQEVLTERQDIDIAYSSLAIIFKETGRLGEALEVLRLGLKNLPDSYDVLSAYVNILINARQYDEVIRVFEGTSLRQMDYDPEIWNYLGVAYTNSGRFSQAVVAFDRSLELDADYPVARNNLGIAYFSQGLKNDDLEAIGKAVGIFREAAALDPAYASPWNGLGIAYRQLGDLDQAAASLEKAVELNPEYGMARYNLGMVYLDQDRKPRALAQFTWYKDKYREALPPGERDKLEALIQQCQK